MSKLAFAGIDVSQESLSVQVRRPDGSTEGKEFPNSAPGHKHLITWIKLRSQSVRVVMESTGTYGLDLAYALESASGVEVMVLASKAAHRFRESLGLRDKDDDVDATVLLEFAIRMPFQPWKAPPRAYAQLRSITRQIRSLMKTKLSQDNQRHAADETSHTLSALLRSADRISRLLEREIETLYRVAEQLVASDSKLAESYRLLQTIKGVGQRSALQILGELCMLPEGLSARQWVSHAGLCPRRFESGKSVHKPGRIGRAGNAYLRAALFMPALCATRTDRAAKAFAGRLRALGKKPIQVIVAVMRKLLHAAHAILHTAQPYQAELVFPAAR